MPEKEQFFKPEEVPEETSKQEKEEFKLAPEDKELVLDVINHLVVQRGLEKYKIFSEYYFGDQLEKLTGKELKKYEVEKLPSREDIKQRADEIFSEDDVYPGILKLGEESGKPAENKDFIGLAARKLGKEGLDELKRAKQEGDFNQALREIRVNRQIEREIKEREEKGILVERIGDMWAEIINDECRPHLPRIAENWPETLKEMKRSYKRLAELLQTDERFKNVKEIRGITWLFGNKGIAKAFDKTFGWNSYTEEEIEGFAEEKPEVYKDMQKVGIEASPRLFRNYLLTGKMPKIGGRWITKEEFIKNYGEK